MASDRILALNIGAGHITLGEFKVPSGKAPVLLRYGVAPLGLEPDSELDPSGFIIAATNDLMKQCGIKPGPLLMAVSGQAVFPRFVKLPAVSPDKLRGMIQSEAEQNVPFPIDELTWDYQVIGSDEVGERNAMIVAAKTESIVALTNSIGAAGLEPEAVDVAPLAIYNCVAGSYSGLEGCTMVLDIGSRSTNLIFVEEGKVFYRSIPVAGNAITSEIAKTFGVDFRTAEKMKREIGFVALGGVTAAEDEQADKISKCIRSVVTRLHAEVNRSVNFYRSQQGGSPPSRLLLTGGSAALQHIDTFFSEKLRIDVDYLNPFGGISFGSHVDEERAAEDFSQLAEVVGLAFRRSKQGIVSINLMPPYLTVKKTLRKQTPVLVASCLALVASAVFALLAGNERKAVAEYERAAFDAKLKGLEQIGRRISAKETELDSIAADLAQYRTLILEREWLARSLDAIRAAMLPGTWLVSLESIELESGSAASADSAKKPRARREEESAKAKGFRIVTRGFQDQLKLKSTNKTAPEIFCERLVGSVSGRPVFASAKVVGQRAADGNNVAEFTVEVALRPVPPAEAAQNDKGEDGKAVER